MKMSKTRLKRKLVSEKRKRRLKEISPLVLSGGKLNKLSDAKEFRVFFHPKKGDDFFYGYSSLEEALKDRVLGVASGKYAEVETPVAVVWDAKKKDYREVEVPRSLMKTAEDRVLRQVG